MPYRDPEKQKEYKREWKRMQAAGGSTGVPPAIPLPFKLRNAQDILSLLSKHIGNVENAEDASTLEKARTIGYLAGVALKAVEIVDLGSRLAKLEDTIKRKHGGAPAPANGAVHAPAVEARI